MMIDNHQPEPQELDHPKGANIDNVSIRSKSYSTFATLLQCFSLRKADIKASIPLNWHQQEGLFPLRLSILR